MLRHEHILQKRKKRRNGEKHTATTITTTTTTKREEIWENLCMCVDVDVWRFFVIVVVAAAWLPCFCSPKKTMHHRTSFSLLRALTKTVVVKFFPYCCWCLLLLLADSQFSISSYTALLTFCSCFKQQQNSEHTEQWGTQKMRVIFILNSSLENWKQKPQSKKSFRLLKRSFVNFYLSFVLLVLVVRDMKYEQDDIRKFALN